MSNTGTDLPTAPRNWCARCGKALWDWSAIYEAPSIVGQIIVCQTCAPNLPGSKHTTWPNTLIGFRDIQRWKRGGR